MKAVLDRADLLRALSRVRGAVQTSEVPILNNVLVRFDDKVSFTTTDLGLMITETIKTKIESTGSAAAPAQTLYEVARRLPDGAKVLIECDGRQMKVKAGRYGSTLPVLPEEDFPKLASDQAPRFTVLATDLRRMLDGVLFAASADDPRSYLRGVYLHSAGNLRAVATNGHQLAQFDLSTETDFPGVILPRRSVVEIARMCDEENEVRVSVSSTLLRLNFGSTELKTKLIDGTFPDYSRVVPLGNDKQVECDRKELESAVGRVQAVAEERGYALKFEASDGTLRLSVRDEAFGSAAEEVMGCEYYEEPVALGLNSKYLMEVLGRIADDVVVISVGDDKAPVLIRGKDAVESLFVVMPMRLANGTP